MSSTEKPFAVDVGGPVKFCYALCCHVASDCLTCTASRQAASSHALSRTFLFEAMAYESRVSQDGTLSSCLNFDGGYGSSNNGSNSGGGASPRTGGLTNAVTSATLFGESRESPSSKTARSRGTRCLSPLDNAENDGRGRGLRLCGLGCSERSSNQLCTQASGGRDPESAGSTIHYSSSCLLGRAMLKLLRSDGTAGSLRHTTGRRRHTSVSRSSGSDSYASSLDSWLLEGYTSNSCPSVASCTMPSVSSMSGDVSPEPEPFYMVRASDLVPVESCRPAKFNKGAEVAADLKLVTGYAPFEAGSIDDGEALETPGFSREDEGRPGRCCGSFQHTPLPVKGTSSDVSDSEDWTGVKRMDSLIDEEETEVCRDTAFGPLKGSKRLGRPQARVVSRDESLQGVRGVRDAMGKHECSQGQDLRAVTGLTAPLEHLEDQQRQRALRASQGENEQTGVAADRAPATARSWAANKYGGSRRGRACKFYREARISWGSNNVMKDWDKAGSGLDVSSRGSWNT